MAWDGLVQPTGKLCSIRHMEYPKFQTGIFGRMESAHLSFHERTDSSKIVGAFHYAKPTGQRSVGISEENGTTCTFFD